MVWLATGLGAFAAGLLQTVTGFGAATVLMLVLPHFFTMTEAAALSSVICMILAASLALRFRAHFRLWLILPPSVIYAAASILAIRSSAKLELGVLSLLFGTFLVLLSLYGVFLSNRLTLRGGTASMAVCSALSGVCAGLFSIGGPTMAVYYLAAARDQKEYLANLQCLFAITYAVGMPARAASGAFSLGMVPLALLGGAGILLGKQMGLICARHLSARRLRLLVYGYVGFTGIVAILGQI